LSTKIHLAADTRCRPISRTTTGGHRHDSIAFEQVITAIRIPRSTGRGRPRSRPGRVLADKAYSASAIREPLRHRRIRAVIPAKANEHLAHSSQFDTAAYTQRNVVERCINKLKLFRALATRYDKRNYIYLGTIDVATIKIWLRDPVP
jgi:transposase